MAKSIVLNRTDTPIDGNPTLTLPRGSVNFGADWRVRSDEPGEVIITNLTSPIDRPEKFRFAMNDIKDIYRNTGIDPTLYVSSRRGASVLCQLIDTWTVIDSADPSYEQVLPVEGHIVLKIPAAEIITADMIVTFVGRLISGLFATGSMTSDRLKAMFRGSLLPPDM